MTRTWQDLGVGTAWADHKYFADTRRGTPFVVEVRRAPEGPKDYALVKPIAPDALPCRRLRAAELLRRFRPAAPVGGAT